MTDREKLIELLNTHCDYAGHVDCKENCTWCLADHLIAHGVTFATDKNDGGKWIPVSERLPRYNHDVLVYRPNMGVKILTDSYVGYYGEDDGEWYEGWAKYGRDTHNNPVITHWMSLPEPPEVTK